MPNKKLETFKVGDKVVYTQNVSNDLLYVTNEPGVVESVDGSSCYVYWKSHNRRYNVPFHELVHYSTKYCIDI